MSPALDDAIANARPLLAKGAPTKARIRILWAAAKKVRHDAPAGEIAAAFMALAVEAGLMTPPGMGARTSAKVAADMAVKMLRTSCAGRCAAGTRLKRGHWNERAKQISA